MPAPKQDKIAIIGCAIAGLANAVGLARQGFDITIFGACPPNLPGGLQLAPNGFDALEQLGLGTVIQPHLTRLSAIEIRSIRTNGLLAVVDHEKPIRRAYASLARADLLHLLHSELRAHKHVHFIEEPVRALSQSEADITCHLASGAQMAFSLVIGADGRHGLSRQMVQGGKTRNKGDRIALRAHCEAADLPAYFANRRTQLWLGDGAHIVHYPLRDGRDVNLVICLSKTSQSHDEALQKIIGKNTILGSLATAVGGWHETELPSAELMPVWRRGRLILTGDAAHFMPPHLAQGAGQTLEDAASLSATISAGDDILHSSTEWAKQRCQQLAPIVRRAEDTGAIMRLGGPLGRLRNLAIDIGGQPLIENWLAQVWRS